MSTWKGKYAEKIYPVVFFDKNGIKISQESFETLKKADVNRYGCMLVLDESEDINKAIVFDKHGNIVFNHSFANTGEDGGRGYFLFDGYVLHLKDGIINIFSLTDNTSQSIPVFHSTKDAIAIPIKPRSGYGISFIICVGSDGFVYSAFSTIKK